MANAAALIWDGFRHPARTVLKHWKTHEPTTQGLSHEATAVAAHGRHSPEQLERIAAYARSGYFHMDYTAGMFVVPLDIPPE
ncbi:hypothetical protein [Paraburkholderia lacunae]|uniref:Uncharacterized protein n=1 Tax=Paraburkholderia lacunae TaxID=2211104 RepID=A0A370MY91_9BURK|nr:hypothetical protein [Paraburkholderia lacunae]RDJ98305.1 hypothetical protein DLM46_33885 [Paraburkholderia lacunae]